jgi:glycosyltransferase involved in cell wall biosynthesis
MDPADLAGLAIPPPLASRSQSALPRISVVTPSLNQGPFLERTIRSVLDQDYSNLEYIIIDGGSTDGSVEIIKKYESQLAYWVSEPDAGQSSAINKGLARATGTILAWLNSDDYYLPGALETIAKTALAHLEAGAFVGAGEIIDSTGKVVYHKDPPPAITLETHYEWMRGGNFMQPSCFFRDAVWRAVAPLDESLHITFDVDLWMRMSKAGCRFFAIDRLLSQALSHPRAKTTAYSNLMYVDFAIVAMRHGGEHAARRHLEDLALRLSWSEPNLEKILNYPVIKLLEPLLSLVMKPAARRRDIRPRWLQR